MYQKIAKIKSTHLGYEDPGIFTAWADVDYGGSGQGIGLYGFDRYNEETKEREGTAFGLEWIMRFMDACGVQSWEKLVGRTIYVLTDSENAWGGKVLGVEPLPTEPGKRFIFEELSEKYHPKDAKEASTPEG